MATLSVLVGVMITITAVLPVFIVAIVPILYSYYRVQVMVWREKGEGV